MNRNNSTEAWLTSVTDNEYVTSALVLAESLRRSKTTKLIGVIVSDNVTKDARNALRKVFDAVFLMDETIVPKGNLTDEERMKIFALSLKFFQTCVFVSPSCLILENADQLFDGGKIFCALKAQKGDGIDMTVFKFVPNLELCEYLSSTVNQNGKFISGKYMRKWFENQPGSMGFSFIEDDFVLKFSVKTASIMREETHAPIIQFVDMPKQGNLEGQLAPLITNSMGYFEQKIVGTWMQIYDQQVAQRLKNPNTNVFPSGYVGNKDDFFANEPIAIIGMSCRYPGANNVEEFWNLLFQGEEGIREPPAFRWVKEHCIRVTPEDRKSQAGFLATTVDEFDAKFFGISPKEATFLDPQTRLLHEVLWESLESSGTDPLSLSGTNTGIFTGSWMNNYTDIINQKSTEKDFFRTYMGNSIGGAAARLSFLLGLTGPSIATESGCSSAIVAVDLAVKSLRSGQSNLALACGVNLLLHPFNSNIMDYVISKNGRCKTFDANADGFGRAEGCGVLVLKRLSDALRDRDNIWAMIRGSAISQEGVSKSMGTPTIHCEALAMTLSLKDANVKPERVSYIETHGTGTAVGDPLEVAAIEKAYGTSNRKSPLIIGSVKTNVGHTESCSGITGIMKTVLSMHNELIPKHLNLETLNPEIDLNRIPANIPLEPIFWPKTEGAPRIAGVSSFGITGTDGHVIIQEAPDFELPRFDLGIERPFHIMKIAAKSNEALEEMLKMYDDLFIQRQENECLGDFADAAFTANTGRASFPHRAFIVAKNYNMAHDIIQSNQVIQGEANEPGKICFLFTGQGSQYLGMAKLLYETSPTFRIHFDSCDKTLRELYNLSIRETLWESDPNSKELSRTIYSQTSIFCVEYCLLQLWKSWGITPDYVLGHSLGEFAAAVGAGILGFRDALKLVAERSRLIESLPKGSMLVIKASKSQVEKLLKSSAVDVDIAAVNSPDQTVVAGDTDDILRFAGHCKKLDMKCTVLEATHAFHSRHMDPMLEEYRKVAETITYKSGTDCLYVSGMEGKILDASAINANYWVKHTREKVSFMDASEALREHDCVNFLEVGPQPILSSFMMLNNEDRQLNCFPSLRRGTNDWQTILTSLGKLFVSGRQVNWKGFDAKYNRQKVSLPFHPFHRKSYWIESNGSTAALIHPLLGYSMSNASTLSIFQNDLSLKSVPYIKDHCIGSRVVFPGAGFTEICLSAGVAVSTGVSDTLEKLRRSIKLENFKIDAPLQLTEAKPCRLQVLVDLPSDQTDDHNGFRVKVFHQGTSEESSGKWILHATANFSPVVSSTDGLKHWDIDRIKEIMSTESSDMDGFYKKVDDAGLRFGETFKSLQKYWTKNYGLKEIDEVVAEVKIPADFSKYVVHPLITDAMFQVGILTKYNYVSIMKNLQVPIRVGEFVVFPTEINPEDEKLIVYAGIEQSIHFAYVMTQNLQPIVFMNDVEMAETNVKTIESVLEQQNSSMPDAWEEVWKPVYPSLSHKLTLPELQSILHSSDVQNRLNENTLKSEEQTLVLKTDRLIYLFIMKALYELDWQPKTGESVALSEFCQNHNIMDQFRELVRFYFTVFEEEGVMSFDNGNDTWTIVNIPPSIQIIESEINNLSMDLREQSVLDNYTYIASYLSKILTGAESALSLLFPVDENMQKYSVAEYYLHHPSRTDCQAKTTVVITSIVNTIKSANNGTEKTLKILEVGAGTGSMTRIVLEDLQVIWGLNFEYYYTDVSQSFFNKAEKTFTNFKKNLKFEVFNIENNALGQGIPLDYFDIVIATDVIHAVRNLEETLAIVRQTMRNDAYIIFTETLGPSRPITFLFGLLEGYWRFEDFDWRPHHSCVEGKVWQSILKQCGFGFTHLCESYFGVNGVISGQAIPYNHSRYISQVVHERKISSQKKDWIVFASDGEGENVTEKVAKTLKSCDWNVEVVPKPQTPDQIPEMIQTLFKDRTLEGIIYAWGMDVNEKDQRNVALPLLHLVQKVLEQIAPPRLYIITQGIVPITDALSCNPTAGTLFGMAKALKNENVEVFVRTIDLDYESRVEDKVEQILFEIAMKGSKNSVREQVIAYREHVKYEPKLTKLNLQAANAQLQLPQSVERFHLVLPKTRVINDLEFDGFVACDMKDDEIEIKVKAYALNFKDILTILKPNEEFEKLKTVGLDFSGTVTKIGKGVTSEKVKVGDRVFGCNFNEGALQSHLVQSADSVLPIPKNMSFWEASTLPAVFATSYYCLVTIAKIKAGDTVLIHTGSGGVGLSAIQLAKHVGATVITTAGSPRKRAYLRSLGIEHVFHSRNTEYEQDIQRVTNGKGVDIVLNSITGPGFKEASLNSCGKNARFVEMSKLGIWSEEEVATRRSDVEYTIVDLTGLNRDEWSTLLSNMKTFLDEGNIKAIPFVKFDALHIRQALQYFQKAKHIGKVVCTMPEVKVQNGKFTVNTPLYNDESTYLITGGLGGIGFEVGKWMLEKGATDLVLTGRNPPKGDLLKKIEDINSKGFNVMVKYADVGDTTQMKSLIDDISSSCKPLRGVMHCAGVLRDNIYQNQNWESFQATFNAKVNGTWNLHNLTRHLPLEHFVFYSSITALIGSPGQPNHSGANSFEDAFTHYRHSLGLPATTINWGQWAEVGVAKEINVAGFEPISVKRMLNGLEAAVQTQRLQTSFCEFDNLSALCLLCPTVKIYIDERVWKQYGDNKQSVQHLSSEVFWKEMDESETKEDKIHIISGHLKRILRVALRLDSEEAIKDDGNLQDLGVDSLMSIEMKNNIQSLLGQRVTITASVLKNCTTVRDIATAIAGKIMGENDESTVIMTPEELEKLLTSDCVLPDSIKPSTDYANFLKPSDIKTILITGCTGQLAPYILQELVSSYKSVNNIVCLIRTKENVLPMDRLITTFKLMNLSIDLSRVSCVRGDVSNPHFGLEENTYNELCSSVDAIIHCAVKSNHIESYHKVDNGSSDIRSVNVGGLLNVLEFASTTRVKHIYHASAFTSIFGSNSNGTLSDEWPCLEEIKVITAHSLPGYQVSKFVCEMLLKEAVLRGIPCKVFRFPWITGEQNTGRLNYMNNHFILRLLSYLKLKAMLSLPFPAQVLPVDICAEWSLKLFLRDDTPLEIYNIGHPSPEVEQEFAQVASDEFGIELDLIEVEEFSKKLKESSPLEALKELYTDVARLTSIYTSDSFKSVSGYYESPATFFENKKLQKYLPGFADTLPSSTEIMRRNMIYIKSTGFFKTIEISTK